MANIGVDLGGHTISAALIDDRGVVMEKRETPTDPSRDLGNVLNSVVTMVEDLRSSGIPCGGLGIGIPGFIDTSRGICTLPNFPECKWIDLARLFGDRISVPVIIENDANCYALGEGVVGAAAGKLDYAVFTLGTGIGGGIVSGGKLMRGAHGMAGEFGHIAGYGDEPCGCGAYGHLESFSGADGIERSALLMGFTGDIPSLWEKRHDKTLWPLWDAALRKLAAAIASVAHILDPEMIILGGGMSGAHGLLNELHPYLLGYTAGPFRPYMDIRISFLGNDAALIGAASLFAR